MDQPSDMEPKSPRHNAAQPLAPVAQLMATLEHEQALLSKLHQQIICERNCIENSEATELLKLSEDKSQTLVELDNQRKLRSQAMIELGLTFDEPGMSQLLASFNEEQRQLGEKLWHSLSDTLRICQQENLINGALITVSHQQTNRLMDSLFRPDAMSTTYNKNGDADKPRHGHIREDI